MTPHFAETMEIPSDWKQQVDVLIFERLQAAAVRTVERHNKKKHVEIFGPGDLVRIRAPNYARRKKRTPMWPYEATVLEKYKNHTYRILEPKQRYTGQHGI